MSEAEKKEKPVDVKIRTYVLTKEIPTEIRYSLNLARFTGMNDSLVNPDLIWGIYGTSSLNSANSYASMDARRLKRKMYQVDLHVPIRMHPPTTRVINRENATESGFFHFERLDMSFRNELLDQMIGYCSEMENVSEESLRIQYPVSSMLNDLLRDKPMLIHRFMAENPNARVCIHSVRLGGGLTLKLGTVRRDVEGGWLEVRHHEGIPAFI